MRRLRLSFSATAIGYLRLAPAHRPPDSSPHALKHPQGQPLQNPLISKNENHSHLMLPPYASVCQYINLALLSPAIPVHTNTPRHAITKPVAEMPCCDDIGIGFAVKPMLMSTIIVLTE